MRLDRFVKKIKLKYSIAFILLVLTSLSKVSGEVVGDFSKKTGVQTAQSPAIINSLDTVVFDLSQAVYTSGSVAVPVYILSDDTVNALDFSMMYNHTNLLYDSVENLTVYLQAFSYYNIADSTIRFTSSSLQQYVNDTSLVAIRFTLLGTQILNSDLNTIVSYLNGDQCSVKLIDAIPTGISEMNDIKVNLYPNPVKNILHIETKENSEISIYDINGYEILHPIETIKSNIEINLINFSEGIYIVKVSNSCSSVTRRIFVDR